MHNFAVLHTPSRSTRVSVNTLCPLRHPKVHTRIQPRALMFPRSFRSFSFSQGRREKARNVSANPSISARVFSVLRNRLPYLCCFLEFSPWEATKFGSKRKPTPNVYASFLLSRRARRDKSGPGLFVTHLFRSHPCACTLSHALFLAGV